MPEFDLIVVGAGLSGLQTALRTQTHNPDKRILVVDREACPGNDVRTQRTNGFVCELGPIAFTQEELDPHLQLLQKPPRIIASNPEASTGWLFDGETLRALRVEPQPISFTSGCEDLVQAYRRELDQCLRLGRAVTQLQAHPEGGFVLTLGGEVPSELHTAEVVLAVATMDAARLLGHLEPELADLSDQAALTERAFVWFGGLTKDAPELRGYGVLPHPEIETSLAEAIICTNVFPRRAMPDRFLLRCETAMAELPEDDDELCRVVEQEVRKWTRTEAAFGFHKVHRFHEPASDGTQAECLARIHEIVGRVPGLAVAASAD